MAVCFPKSNAANHTARCLNRKDSKLCNNHKSKPLLPTRSHKTWASRLHAAYFRTTHHSRKIIQNIYVSSEMSMLMRSPATCSADTVSGISVRYLLRDVTTSLAFGGCEETPGAPMASRLLLIFCITKLPAWSFNVTNNGPQSGDRDSSEWRKDLIGFTSADGHAENRRLVVISP